MREIKFRKMNIEYSMYKNNKLEILTCLFHEPEFPLQWETLCSTLGSQVSACPHHPCPSAAKPIK